MIVYYLICTYVSKPTELMIEDAVYPPQKGEVTPMSIEGQVVTEEVIGAYLKSEKEVSL